MHSLLLIVANQREFTVDSLRQVFESATGFTNLRFDTPTGTPIEARYQEGEDFTTVRLISTRQAISIRGTSGAAVGAAWIMKSHLGIPLRMVDSDYSFDLLLDNYTSRNELESAIEAAQAS